MARKLCRLCQGPTRQRMCESRSIVRIFELRPRGKQLLATSPLPRRPDMQIGSQFCSIESQDRGWVLCRYHPSHSETSPSPPLTQQCPLPVPMWIGVWRTHFNASAVPTSSIGYRRASNAHRLMPLDSRLDRRWGLQCNQITRCAVPAR